MQNILTCEVELSDRGLKKAVILALLKCPAWVQVNKALRPVGKSQVNSMGNALFASSKNIIIQMKESCINIWLIRDRNG